ncbi:LOW QUALITY PROTEIN: uncharacterized protein LOC134214220 [Armigeres subalbatus]|uniref:LOW QUALITY PROTEIN: uncharacterized protein LOC134214220 n=1 Tax=Armigeres subalbatus TaxID=124917 RepID=UPI002ED6A128
MPFVIVETRNSRGCKELSVVPDKWLRSSRSGQIVLWPNVKSVLEQEKLLRDENSLPKKSWLKFKCTVKRNPMSSLTEAKRLLGELSGESSSDVGQLARRKINKRQEPEDFQNMLVLENTPSLQITQVTPAATPIVVEVRESFENKIPPKTTTLAPSSTRFVPVAESMIPEKVQIVQQSFPPGTDSAVPTVVAVNSEDNVQSVQYVAYHAVPTITQSDNPREDNLSEIIKLLHQINNRLDLLEKRTASISTQNEYILNAIRRFGCQVTDIEEQPLFRFDPIEHEQQLSDLENKLTDDDYKSSMIKWLRLNVSGDCVDNRMLGVLDMLFSKEFQTKCTWTGASRKGPKIAIMPNRNILQMLFQQLGSDDSEIVTQLKLTNFFMRKLKNSLKRLTATGMRRGTRHVRRVKQRKEAVHQVKLEHDGGLDEPLPNPLNDCDNYVDDCDNNHSKPELEELDESAIDSSDALDCTDIRSDTSGPNDFSE